MIFLTFFLSPLTLFLSLSLPFLSRFVPLRYHHLFDVFPRQCGSSVAAMFKIANTDDLPPMPASLTPEARDFIVACLVRDPRRRPNGTRNTQEGRGLSHVRRDETHGQVT